MKKSIFISAFSATLFASLSCASAAIVSIPAIVDNSGIIEDGGANQDARGDTLWGNTANNATKQRNGLVTFSQLSASDRAGLIGGSLILNSATLRLTSTTNAWASTSLNFMRLDDANADYVSNQASWAEKSSGSVWVGGAGGGTRGQVFGTLTSTGTGTGGVVFDVPLSGSELLDWLTSATIAPSLLVEEIVPGTGAQTRFATLESTGAGQVEPTLILDITPIPEPGSAALLLLSGLLAFRRRR